jgi:hypothetical protein
MVAEYRKSGISWFAVAVAAAVLVVGLLMAALRLRAGDPPGLLAIPVVAAGAVLAYLTKSRKERLVPTTTNLYTVFTPRFRDRQLSELLVRVRSHGYQIAAWDASAAGADLGARDPALKNLEIRLRDRRTGPTTGEVIVRLTVQDSGALLGYLEAVDSEAGFYDELAQFIVADMADLWDELEYTHTGSGDRCMAAELRSRLPGQPYGLALLP